MRWILLLGLCLSAATWAEDPHEYRIRQQRSSELLLKKLIDSPYELANVHLSSLTDMLVTARLEKAEEFSKEILSSLSDPALRQRVVSAQYLAASRRILQTFDLSPSRVSEHDPSFDEVIGRMGARETRKLLRHIALSATSMVGLITSFVAFHPQWKELTDFYLPNLLGTSPLTAAEFALLPIVTAGATLRMVQIFRRADAETSNFHQDRLRRYFDQSERDADKEQIEDRPNEAEVRALLDRPQRPLCNGVFAAVLPQNLRTLLVGTAGAAGIFAAVRTPVNEWAAERTATWQEGKHAIENLITDLDAKGPQAIDHTAEIVARRTLASSDRTLRMPGLHFTLLRFDTALKAAGRREGLGFPLNTLGDPDRFIKAVDDGLISELALRQSLNQLLVKEYQDRKIAGETHLTPRDLLRTLGIRHER